MKWLPRFDTLSQVFNILIINAIFWLVVVISLKLVVEYRLEAKQDRLVQVMNSATRDNPESRVSVMRVLLESDSYQGLAAPWIILLSGLETEGYYAQRDDAFFRALRHLDPYEMKIFLNTTQEIVAGPTPEVRAAANNAGVDLPPVVSMTDQTRRELVQCQELLSRTINIVPKDQYAKLEPLQQVFNDYQLAFPSLAFDGCDL